MTQFGDLCRVVVISFEPVVWERVLMVILSFSMKEQLSIVTVSLLWTAVALFWWIKLIQRWDSLAGGSSICETGTTLLVRFRWLSFPTPRKLERWQPAATHQIQSVVSVMRIPFQHMVCRSSLGRISIDGRIPAGACHSMRLDHCCRWVGVSRHVEEATSLPAQRHKLSSGHTWR